nr:putative succinate-semialdehyde dehydrogenase [nadp(+)] [Quercus suber]
MADASEHEARKRANTAVDVDRETLQAESGRGDKKHFSIVATFLQRISSNQPLRPKLRRQDVESNMAETITTISPTTNQPVVERNGLSEHDLAELPKTAQKAFLKFRQTPLAERQRIVKRALEIITERQDELAQEITEQMGRPIAYTAKEVTTAVMRGEFLLKVSDKALQDTPGDAQEGFQRYVRKTPLGPVLVLFAWNVSLP